jgi:2-oxo-4-hydroxy-4-carboxy-5-ureidoimidazoline decarboxylase
VPGKITIEEVNELGREEFVAKFGPLFEESPWVVERAWQDRPFECLSEVQDPLNAAVHAASEERQLALIRAHPDLAGKAAIKGTLTPESTREQASAGLDRLSPQEYETFTETNRAYREKFGFPMVVCVREHMKESILASAAARLKRSREEEFETALDEISMIANLRLQDLVEPNEGAAQTSEKPESAGTRGGRG